MNWEKFAVFLCVLGLVLTLPAPEPVRQAGAPAEVTLDGPPLVALTFDDGPRSSTTGPLLDGLALREVPATFFLVGNRIPGNEDLVRRMAAEGHQIGIHTYDHVKLKGLSRQDFDLQVGKTRALITRLAGEGNYWLRPPYGLLDKNAEGWCGGPVILWSVDPEDWNDKNTPRIVEHIVSRAQDGDVILLHDIYPTSVEAALQVVDALHERGFLFVTVDELARERHVELEAGKVYRNFYP